MHQFCAHASNRLLVQSPRLGLAKLSCRSYRLQVNATSLLDKTATSLNANKYAAPNQYTTINNPTATLNSGHKIPLLGLGTWRGEAGQVEHAIETAVRGGCRWWLEYNTCVVNSSQLKLPEFSSSLPACACRHIDCAAAYGNEDKVGIAFANIFKEGKVERKDLWITSKLNNPDHDPTDVRKACEKTIKDLQAEYLDLYLMHWPLTGNKGKTVEPPIKVSCFCVLCHPTCRCVSVSQLCCT